MESKYYKATDVMAMLECSETYAYKVIRQLNEELEADGYITVRGKVPKQYLEKKWCRGGLHEIKGNVPKGLIQPCACRGKLPLCFSGGE